jgi:hypothetical protein
MRFVLGLVECADALKLIIVVRNRTLDLSGCNEMTDRALNSISVLVNLKELNIQACSQISAKGFRVSISQLVGLEVRRNSFIFSLPPSYLVVFDIRRA